MIKKVEMLTHSILELKEFYMGSLELPIVNETPSSFSVKVGASILTFIESSLNIKPMYHFAFNIPENKIDEAVHWLAPKVPLILDNGKQIVNFEDWNAHSIYFNDPVGNLVELIARHDLNNATNELFSPESLLCVSEIGLPVLNVEDAIAKLSHVGMSPWQEYNHRFAAVGDEQGLLIVVSKGRVWFMSEKESYPYNLTIETDECSITLDDSNGLIINRV